MQNNKKGFSAIILLPLLLIVFAGVFGYMYFSGNLLTKQEELKSSATTSEVMKVAKYYWPGTFWTEIADEKGWFKEAGLNVELIDTNSDYYASLQDTVDSKIDTNNFPLFDFLYYNTTGANLVAVLGADVSNGAAGIVANQNISNITDLVGKKIGVAQGTFSEYMLEVVLTKNNIDLSSVEIVNVATENTIDLLESREVDAVVSWEPLMSQAVTDLGANIVFDTSELFGLDASVWVFNKDFISKREGDVAAFIKVWAKTSEYILKNPKEAYQIIADNYGVTVSDVEAYVASDKILSLAEAKQRFNYSAGFDSTQGLVVEMNDFMIKKGLTEKTLKTNDILDSRFVTSIK